MSSRDAGADWSTTTLGKVCEINPPKPTLTGLADETPVLFVPMASVDEVTGTVATPEQRTLGEVRTKSYKTFAPQDIIFAKITPCMENGKCAVVPDIPTGLGYGSTEFHVLRPRSGVNPRYIWHFIRQGSFRRQAEDNMSGSVGQLRVPADFLAGFPIELPSEALQRKIVDMLDLAEASGQSASTHLATANLAIERFRQAVLAAACSGRLTADWRTSHIDAVSVGQLLEAAERERRQSFGRKCKSPPLIDEGDLPKIPESWRWTSLASLILHGPQNGLYLPQSKYGAGTPILRIEDYQLDWSRASNELKLVAASTGDRQKYALQTGDIVVNRVNSPSHLGKAMLVEERNLPSLFESNMMRLSLVRAANCEYVALFLQSMVGRRLLTKSAKWAVNQASINQGDVTSTPIALPGPEEQGEIVRSVRRLIEGTSKIGPLIDRAAMCVERSRDAVLAKAVRGELTITLESKE
jgi:type I restriction enzyme S subunit